MRVLWLLVVVLLVPVWTTGAAAADAGAPPDYTAQAGQLSQPVYSDVVTELVRVPMSDGVEISIKITRPDPATYPDLRIPVIMTPTPYHMSNGGFGRGELPGPTDAAGNRIGLQGYFPSRGYAVALMDLRGNGHSAGCAGQVDQRDAADLKTVVEWLADQSWSTGRVAAVGHSFNGFATAATAAQQPKGLVTSVILAGSGSAYDFQFQHGVPYYAHAFSPIWAYPSLTMLRYVQSPVPFPIQGFVGHWEPSQQYAGAGCGYLSGVGAAPGAATGQYLDWHAQRDFRKQVAAADMPLFVVHGVDDHSARMTGIEWFFRDRAARSDDKLWVGPWDHGHGANRGDQWTAALHAWLDHHLQQLPVSTGPSVEAFFEGGSVLTAPAWEPAQTQTWYPDATTNGLKLTPPQQSGTETFTAQGNADFYSDGEGVWWGARRVDDDGGVEFTSAPLTNDLVLFGLPELRLHASITGATTNLVTTLWRQSEDGTRRLLNICAIAPQLRNGVETVTPVTPGETMTLQPQCFTTAHHVAAGEELVLRVGTGSHQHVPLHSADAQITVHTGPDATAYGLPVRPGAQTYPDPIATPTPEDG